MAAEKHPNCIYPLCGCSGTADCKSDPMNTPLPCDVKVGSTTFRKGVALRSLVLHANRLRDELHHRWADALTDAAAGVKAVRATQPTDDELLDLATDNGLPFGKLPADYCRSVNLPEGTRCHGEVTKEALLRFTRAVLALGVTPTEGAQR